MFDHPGSRVIHHLRTGLDKRLPVVGRETNDRRRDLTNHHVTTCLPSQVLITTREEASVLVHHRKIETDRRWLTINRLELKTMVFNTTKNVGRVSNLVFLNHDTCRLKMRNRVQDVFLVNRFQILFMELIQRGLSHRTIRHCIRHHHLTAFR